MPIIKTSSTYADEFITGTSTNINANVSDVITATHNIYYENTVDASQDSSYSIRMTNTDSLSSFENFSGYDSSLGYIILILNSELSSAIPSSQIDELLNKEITTLGFVANFTSNVLAVNADQNGHKIVLNNVTSVVNQNKTNGIFYVSSAIGSCSIDYAFDANTNNNLFSPAIIIDGEDTISPNFSTLTNTLDASSASVITIPFKYDGAYQTGSLTIQGKGVTTSGDIYNRQSFEIVHTIKAAPESIYRNSNGTQPSAANLPSSNLINTSSLFTSSNTQSNYKLDVNLLTSPTDSRPVNLGIENTEGRVSVIGQKYLGGTTSYSTSNFSIIRTSDSEVSDVPLVQVKFTVSFDVENTSSVFSDLNTKVKVIIQNIPESWDNTENNIQTFLTDSVIATLGDAPTTGTATGDAASITNYTATYNSGTSITCSFDVEYTAGAKTQINLNTIPFFSILVETQDHTLDYTNSDRVVLQPFVGAGIQNILVPPVVIDSTVFLPFKETLFANGIANTSITGYPTQLLVGTTRFSIDWTDRSTLRLNSINQQLVFVNSSTLEEFVVDSDTLNTSGLQLIANTYPLGGTTINKGFKIPSTEVRNFINFINDGSVGDEHFFQVWFPFFLRWEYYTKLFLNSVPSTIIDNTEPFDGVNFDLYRIDQLANWTLNYRLNFTCFEDVELTQTFDLPITLVDYDADVDTVSRAIKSYTEDEATELTFTGVKYIQNKENTLIYVEWDTGFTINDIADFEIEILAEPKEGGSPNKIQRISSINSLLSSSWFTDTGAGDGLVAKSISGTKAVGKALIDKDKLSLFSDYRFYGVIDYIESVITWTFQTTNDISVEAFDPDFTPLGASGELATWILKNGTTYTDINSLNIPIGTTLSGDELDGTVQNVDVTFNQGTPSNMIWLSLVNDKIYGNVDLTLFTGALRFYFSGNSGITSVTNPTSSSLIQAYDFSNCGINTAVDLTSFSRLAGSILLYNNSIPSLLFGSSSDAYISVWIYNNPFTTIDLSGMVKFSNNFRCYSCSNLTSLTLPTQDAGASLINVFWVYDCDIAGLDITSKLTKLASGITFYAYNNNLSVTDVNNILIQLDSVLGVGTAVIQLQGQTTTATPTGAGATAKANLISNGHTVTTD